MAHKIGETVEVRIQKEPDKWALAKITSVHVGSGFYGIRYAASDYPSNATPTNIRRISQRRLMLTARNQHSRRTGHTDIVVGGNFVECRECGKHAHLNGDCVTLIHHNADGSVHEQISAVDF